MEKISVRELRQNASQWLRRVLAGESFEVTARGRPVAMLGPVPEDPWERLIREGKLKPGKGNLLDLGPPLPPAPPGQPTLSEILEEMRNDERW